MSEPIKPCIEFQSQVMQGDSQWCNFSDPAQTIEDARCNLHPDFTENRKTRIIKQTTTSEVVEEMEPKS